MLRTFKAWLKGTHLVWIGDEPEMRNQALQVHVTVLDEEPISASKTSGQKMAEILEKLAATQVLNDINPMLWQQETRQDRSLPGR